MRGLPPPLARECGASPFFSFFFFLLLFQLTYGYHSRDSMECCKKRLATGRELVVRADTIGLENVDEIERRSSITHVLVRQSVVKTNYSVLRYSRKGERRGGSFKCTALFSAPRIERYFPEVERHARKKRANLLLVLKPYGIYRNIRLVNKAKPTDRRIYSLRSFDLFVVDTLSKTLGEGINLFWSQRSE